MTMIRYTLAVVLVALAACANQRIDNRPFAQLSGVELYERLCASCHGARAQGDGPVAPLIEIKVPDLRSHSVINDRYRLAMWCSLARCRTQTSYASLKRNIAH